MNINPINVVIERRKRKTLSIVVNREGKVLILAPLKASQSWIQEIIEQKRPWIEKHVLKAQRKQHVNIHDFVLGEKFSETQALQKTLLLTHAEKEIRTLVEIWWPKINQGRLKQSPMVKFRKMKTRWGTYHSKGIVTLNRELLHFPRECGEYVVVHELCHAFQANHGQKFYSLLTSHLPDWKLRKKRLSSFLEATPSANGEENPELFA